MKRERRTGPQRPHAMNPRPGTQMRLLGRDRVLVAGLFRSFLARAARSAFEGLVEDMSRAQERFGSEQRKAAPRGALIADNDPFYLAPLEHVLERCGFKVTSADRPGRGVGGDPARSDDPAGDIELDDAREGRPRDLPRPQVQQSPGSDDPTSTELRMNLTTCPGASAGAGTFVAVWRGGSFVPASAVFTKAPK
jgi:hypothetical protein